MAQVSAALAGNVPASATRTNRNAARKIMCAYQALTRPCRSVRPDALELRPRRGLHRHELGSDLGFDFLGELRTRLQEFTRVVLALANALALVAVPGARLLDDALRRTHVDDLAFARNAHAVHDFELGLAERRRHLVLDHLHAGLVADDFFAILDGPD